MDSIDALNELSVLVSSYNYKDPNDRFHYCKYTDLLYTVVERATALWRRENARPVFASHVLTITQRLDSGQDVQGHARISAGLFTILG